MAHTSGKIRIGLPASLVGSYELRKELAVGGMGVIYLAHDLKNERDVVFKFIAEDLLGDQETKIRFANEAKLTAQLEHPNIVQVYRAGEEDGIFFIIYEFLDGRNLKTLLEMHGAYPVGKALDILIKVSDGIAYAHSEKILHRDIKPENILVSPLGDMVKILDFGIAKSIEDAQKLTQTGFIIGTPEYLSPEQAVGHKASYMSDQYALAVLAYEILTGRLPIEDTNTVDLFTKKIRGAWVPINERVPHIPPDLQKIIEKAMATEAGQRYASVGDMLQALKNFAGKRTTANRSQMSGIAKRDPALKSVDASGLVQRPATAPSVMKPGKGTATAPRSRPDWLGTAVTVAGAVVALLIVAMLWRARPVKAPESFLPHMTGSLETTHQLDGIEMVWDPGLQGAATLTLGPSKAIEFKPGKGTKQMVMLNLSDIGGIEKFDLTLKDPADNRVLATVAGIPFVRVERGAETISVEVPTLPESSPVVALWHDGSPQKITEFQLKATSGHLGVHKAPLTENDTVYFDVCPAGGGEKYCFRQRVLSLVGSVSKVEDRFDELGLIEALRETDPAQKLPELLKKAQEVLAPSLAAVDRLKEALESNAVDLSIKMSLAEKVSRLALVLEIARRTGRSRQMDTELEKLRELPWPVKVNLALDEKKQGDVKGAALSQNKSDLTLAAAPSSSTAVQILFFARGPGGYLKLVLGERNWSFYLCGPEHREKGAYQPGKFNVLLDPGLLKSGKLHLELTAESVPGLAESDKDLGFIPPKFVDLH